MTENLPKPHPEEAFGWWPTKFSSLWEELAKRTPFGLSGSDVTLAEDDQNIYVEAKMPGLSIDDIEVTLDDRTLWIRGERKEEKKEKKKYYQKSVYSYSYRVTIPSYADEKKLEANYEDGVMVVTFKKHAREKKGQTIVVKKKGP